MRKMIAFFVALTLVLSGMTFAVSYASTEQDKLGDVNNKLDKTQQQLAAGKKKATELNNQIKALDSKIQTQQKEIAELQQDMNTTSKRINAAQKTLDETKAAMQEQNANLDKRLRAMYKNGDVGLVEILLGSQNIADFMTNMDMVQKIFDNDIELLKYIEAQYAKIDAQKKALDKLQNQLTAEKKNEADQQKALEGNRGEVSTLKAEVAKDNKALEQQIDELNKQADELIAKIRALQGNDAYYGGEFAWPSPGYTRITSAYGYRVHPILKVKKMHTGIDIGVPSKSKVVAANAGTVIMADWYGGYGNVVMIDHGGDIVSLYAHNSSFAVKNGDVVKKGQTICYSGSTGNSTGPHLHFEVRINGKYEDPMKWLK
jgi:murein DD-endopeptidase MepM/ murein hydrolase activator NlpD